MSTMTTTTCFQVICQLRPEYVEFVRNFIDHSDWPFLETDDEGHEAVRDWLQFQREHGRAMIHFDKNNYRGVIFQPEKHESFIDDYENADIFYHNSPPFGLYSPRWGQKCELRIHYEEGDDEGDERDEEEDDEEYNSSSSKSRIWWEFTGQTTNNHGEIDFFVRRVVGALSDEIFLYRTAQNYEV